MYDVDKIQKSRAFEQNERTSTTTTTTKHLHTLRQPIPYHYQLVVSEITKKKDDKFENSDIISHKQHKQVPVCLPLHALLHSWHHVPPSAVGKLLLAVSVMYDGWMDDEFWGEMDRLVGWWIYNNCVKERRVAESGCHPSSRLISSLSLSLSLSRNF